MWNGWVIPDKTGVYIIGHWNYQPGTKKDVYVIASGDKAELFVNNVSQGFGEKKDGFAFTFKNIEWKAGILKAISYDQSDKKLAEMQIKTAGQPVALKLITFQNLTGMKADGADLAFAEVEVVDAAGNRCPTALNTISFTLDGPAEWRRGIAQGPNNYILSKTLPVECGVNRVIVRSTTKAGKITLTANAQGLKPVTLVFQSAPVKVIDGLAFNLSCRWFETCFKTRAYACWPFLYHHAEILKNCWCNYWRK